MTPTCMLACMHMTSQHMKQQLAGGQAYLAGAQCTVMLANLATQYVTSLLIILLPRVVVFSYLFLFFHACTALLSSCWGTSTHCTSAVCVDGSAWGSCQFHWSLAQNVSSAGVWSQECTAFCHTSSIKPYLCFFIMYSLKHGVTTEPCRTY